ncbi:hypothetical protein CRU98_10070 [Arcobacter sp. CECT 8986]|uniref:hypothetical protein n=1 Tax=Arcobacter sp. CECT 8986 TaxID=2044507 RepID=UPI001009C6A2|nr:hypothetical protein [Arcobacter sp. CECT 8986]RXJ98375.1 hypothetical protein CRU98_10070 [Arcobacter sp. CECT 8986]
MGHMNKITTLNDIVDTLKLQFYPNSISTFEEMELFNSTVDMFLNHKEEAQNIKNHDNQKRFVNVEFAKTKFRVMATSQSGFNVVIQNGDITISLLKYSNTHNNPLVKVEFRAEFLLRFGYKSAIQSVKNIVNNFFSNYIVKVSEIHLAKDIQGYEFTSFDLHRIKTLSKTKTIHHNNISSEHYYGNAFTGFSIGKGSEMLRIYNKTVEISQKKEKSFVQVLSWELNPNFDKSQNVWRIEFQFRRDKLKYLLGDNGLLDSLENVLTSISQLWSYATSRFVHKQLSTKQVIEQIHKFTTLEDGSIFFLNPETLRKRFQRADISFVWENILSFNNIVAPKLQKIKDIKKPEVEYVKNAYKAVISTFVKLKRGDFNSDELSQILIDANKELKESQGITLIDKARLNALDYMSNAQVFYSQNGIIEDGFYHYKKDLLNNIKNTYAIIDGEPTTIVTFEQYQKKLMRVNV